MKGNWNLCKVTYRGCSCTSHGITVELAWLKFSERRSFVLSDLKKKTLTGHQVWSQNDYWKVRGRFQRRIFQALAQYNERSTIMGKKHGETLESWRFLKNSAELCKKETRLKAIKNWRSLLSALEDNQWNMWARCDKK